MASGARVEERVGGSVIWSDLAPDDGSSGTEFLEFLAAQIDTADFDPFAEDETGAGRREYDPLGLGYAPTVLPTYLLIPPAHRAEAHAAA